MINVPCETIVRLSKLLPPADADVEPIIRTLRLDNGRVIATDRMFAAVEQVAPFEGVFHITVSSALATQCEIETQFSSVLQVTPNPMLQWTSARTSLGYDVTENIGVYPVEPTAFDHWYERIVAPCLTPAPVSRGALVCQAEDVARLAATSPSGLVVFEGHIDISRPTLLRDAHSHDWVGFFHPRQDDGIYYAPATVPTWLREDRR